MNYGVRCVHCLALSHDGHLGGLEEGALASRGLQQRPAVAWRDVAAQAQSQALEVHGPTATSPILRHLSGIRDQMKEGKLPCTLGRVIKLIPDLGWFFKGKTPVHGKA